METRQFRYRPHIKWFQYGLVVVLALGWVLPDAVLAVVRATAGEVFWPNATSALVFGVTTLGLFWLFRSMASTRVIVNDEGIRYVDYKKDFCVPYSEIERLAFPAIPYLGGWLKIKSDHPDIRLTLVLEDLDELVRMLKEGLDAAEHQGAYHQRKLFRFYKTAGIATQSWDRIYRHFIALIVASLFFAVLGVAAIYFFGDFCADGPSLGLLFAILGLATAPAFSYTVAEVAAIIVFRRGCDEETFAIPAADSSNDRRFFTIGVGIYAGLIAAGTTTLLVLGL